MIERYSTPAMTKIWNDQAKIERWVGVEMAVLIAQAQANLVPMDWVGQAAQAEHPTVEAVEAAELRTNHDVVAFLEAWGPKHVHIGMTSSDLVETAQGLALKDANDLLVAELERLMVTCRDHAADHWKTYRQGRTHGQAATVDTWGHRMADFTFALERQLSRLNAARADVQTVKMSGPTGTYSNISREVEIAVADLLGLNLPSCSSQILMRDSLAHWAAVVAQSIGICEAIATEIRLLSHSAVAEVAEGRVSQQIGSSSMPHKRNPMLSERICGLSRLARSYSGAIAQGVVQWHERDLAHSSVERVALADLCQVAHYTLQLTRRVISELSVSRYAMLSAAVESPLLSSHHILTRLELAGIPRAAAHKIVSEATEDVFSGRKPSLAIAAKSRISQAFPGALVDFNGIDAFKELQQLDWMLDALMEI